VEAASAPTQTEAPPETDVAPAQLVGGATTFSGEHRSTEPPETSDDARGERDESGRYLSREAASYRRRLRETETERDELRAQLDRVQTAEAERLASAAGLAAPSDLWQFGASLETLRGDDGAIDAEAVNGLVDEIVANRPGLRASPVGDLGIGRGGAAIGLRTEQGVGLSALLKPGRR
jgi:hypothetical protein